MRVTKPLPDEVVLSCAESQLARFISPGDPTRDLLAGPDRITDRIYVLPASELANLSSIQASAMACGWRFLAGSDAQPVASFVCDESATTAVAITNVQHGGRLVESKTSAEWIEGYVATIPEIQGTEYEYVVLNVPFLYAETYWLYPKEFAPGPQFILPYRTMIPGIADRTLLRAEDFVAAIKAFAAQKAAQLS